MTRPLELPDGSGDGTVGADDRAIIEAIRSGQPEAAARFVLAHQASVYRLCWRMMRHQQDAEDVVQDTFVRALGAIGGFDLERPVPPWLLGIAANRCRTALAQRARRPALVDQVVEAPDPRPGLADADDLNAEIDRAMGKLRPEYRLVFSLYHESGLLYDEIAEAIDRPVGTVKTWLRRARTQLATDLARRGICC